MPPRPGRSRPGRRRYNLRYARRLATPEQVQSALREILDDPELRLYWRDWELELYVDVQGEGAEPRAEPGAATTWIGYETRRVGAVVQRRACSKTMSSLDRVETLQVVSPDGKGATLTAVFRLGAEV